MTEEYRFTESQIQRMREYGDGRYDEEAFDTAADRDAMFTEEIGSLVAQNEKSIRETIDVPGRHMLSQLEADLAASLIKLGFVEVRTPTIVSTAALAKMTVTGDHPLYKQMFLIDSKRCLRPMLAPNLYKVMRELRDHTNGPVKIFEIGSCFRKESHSSNHLEEFTMLNLVEMGETGTVENLKKYMATVMETVGLDYKLTDEESDVYKATIDVEVNGEEVASGAVGPHALDPAHDVHEPWCGVGFGLERLLMLREGKENIRKTARSNTYLNGAKIN
jgi:pyrrolysyl-tRNA synthetase-like protein